MNGKIISIRVSLIMWFCSSFISYADTFEVPLTETVAFNEVTAMFSNNLATNDELLSDLLLAVAIDHTASNAPDDVKHIGIPYILEKGMKYWALKLGRSQPTVDAIVNNALFLLFSKNRNKSSKEAALSLMQMAVKLNYWPAKYYVAEYNLRHYLSVEYDKRTTKEISDQKLRKIARTTMSHYTDCAKRGFAPCQYRVGTWLITNSEQTKDGLKALESSIQISLDDIRYQDMFDIRRTHAAFIITKIGRE